MQSPADNKPSASAFSWKTDSTRVYLSSRDREVLRILDTAIRQGQRVLLLTGEPGTGKTVVSRALVEGLAGTGVRVGWLPSPDLDPHDFYEILSEGFPDHLAAGDDFLEKFRRFLDEVRGQGQWLLLVIDDAHALRPALFPELLRLLDADELVNRGQPGVLKILLVGRSSLETTLEKPECLALTNLIWVRSMLRPLTASEAREYVVDRLGAAGLGPDLITPEALHEVVAVSGGRPRSINVVCDRALRAASLSGAKTIDGALLQRTREAGTREPLSRQLQTNGAGRERRIAPQNTVAAAPSRRWVVVSFVSAVVLGALLAFGALVYLAGVLPSRIGTVPGVRKAAELPERRLDTIGPVSAGVPLAAVPHADGPKETTPSAKSPERPSASVSSVTKPAPDVPATVRSDRPTATGPQTGSVEPPTEPGLRRAARHTVKSQASTTTTDEPEPSAIIDWLVKEGPRLRD